MLKTNQVKYTLNDCGCYVQALHDKQDIIHAKLAFEKLARQELAQVRQERDQARADLQTVVDYAGKLEAQAEAASYAVADLLDALREIERQTMPAEIAFVAQAAIERAEKVSQP